MPKHDSSRPRSYVLPAKQIFGLAAPYNVRATIKAKDG